MVARKNIVGIRRLLCAVLAVRRLVSLGVIKASPVDLELTALIVDIDTKVLAAHQSELFSNGSFIEPQQRLEPYKYVICIDIVRQCCAACFLEQSQLLLSGPIAQTVIPENSPDYWAEDDWKLFQPMSYDLRVLTV